MGGSRKSTLLRFAWLAAVVLFGTVVVRPGRRR